MMEILYLGLSNVVVAGFLGSLAWLATRWRRPALGHVLYLLALLKLVSPALYGVPLWQPATAELLGLPTVSAGTIPGATSSGSS